jgi:hypothetical protein
MIVVRWSVSAKPQSQALKEGFQAIHQVWVSGKTTIGPIVEQMEEVRCVMDGVKSTRRLSVRRNFCRLRAWVKIHTNHKFFTKL